MNNGKHQMTSGGFRESKLKPDWEGICYRLLLLLMMLVSLAVFILLCKFVIDIVSMLINFLTILVVSVT